MPKRRKNFWTLLELNPRHLCVKQATTLSREILDIHVLPQKSEFDAVLASSDANIGECLCYEVDFRGLFFGSVMSNVLMSPFIALLTLQEPYILFTSI